VERRWAIEGATGIGRPLAQKLAASGEEVVDVLPKISAKVRVLSTGNARKNDRLDATFTALAALRNIVELATIAAILAFLVLAEAEMALPVMTGLGPLMVLQYAYWRRKRGQERTTWQYLRAEPPNHLRPAKLVTESSTSAEKPM
jgi:hypothetical protein